MIQNYFKIAFRNLFKNKVYSFVNIAGLALGLACVMLISLYVRDEVSFDGFHENGNRIYRVVQVSQDKGEVFKSGNTGIPQGPAFKNEIPEVENFSRLKGWEILVKKDNQAINQLIIYTDNGLLNMFSLDWLQGNKKTALTDKNSVVITEEMANKYFGTTDVLGKTVEIEQEEVGFKAFTVAGVTKKMPVNSSIQFDFLLPLSLTYNKDHEADWMSSFLNTFVILRPDANPKAVEAKMAKVLEKYNGKNFAEYQKKYGKATKTYHLQPFKQMHLDEEFFASNGLQNWSNAQYSYILSGIALFILLLACINFINLTLARALQRSKEIGIRKVTGGSRKQLVWQMMGETFLYTLLAFIPALLLVQLFLPSFCELTHKKLEALYLFNYQSLSIGIGLVLLNALVVGFYPALVLSSFNPVQTLYGRFKLSGKNYLGKTLVVVQFSIAIFLICGTIILQRQFDFLTSKDLGYTTDNILSFDIPWDRAEKLVRPFKNELAQLPEVKQVSATNWGFNKTSFEIDGKPTEWTYHQKIDENFLSLFNIPIKAGRGLSYGNVADTLSNCIINEAFAKKFGWKDALGKTIKWQEKTYTVVGVTDNYHNASLHENIEPIFLYMKNDKYQLQIYVKVASGKMQATAKQIGQIFKRLVPLTPFSYQTYQDSLKQKYEEEQNWRDIITFAALIAILIACLGLFGLAAFTGEQRIREVGVRKVLGASVMSITTLLSKDLLKLVCIAIVVATPLAYYLANQWLEDFPYKITVSWWIFALAGASAIIIALLTVSYQAIKAALMNPVKSLKTE